MKQEITNGSIYVPDIVGGIMMFAGFRIIDKYLPCDGQELSINDYPVLFSVIGTIYGGDGTKTFCLPNLSCRFPIGAGQGVKLTKRKLGELGGVEEVTLTEPQLPAHKHDYFACNQPPAYYSPLNSMLAKSASIFYAKQNIVMLPKKMNEEVISTTGGNSPHNNMNPFLAINFMICYDGIYPTR